MQGCVGASGALDIRGLVALNGSWRGGERRQGRCGFRGWVRVERRFRCDASARRGEVKKQEKGGEECGCANGDLTTASTSSNGRSPDVEGAIPGLILPPLTTVGKSTNITWEGCMVKREERQRMLNQKGCVIWITGLSGSGKSTLACTLDHALLQRGKLSYVLDGDNVRHGLNNNLGFSAEDRAENIRRVGEVAKLFADTGVICIASFISPYKKDRDACRKLMAPGDFIEVFMDVALEVCEQRDPKGLYKLARAGKIKGFTGVDDPYEDPQEPEIVMKAVNGEYASPQEMTVQMLAYLEENGFLKGT
ncbi:hypothetical protein KC19_3G082500 [Ceratodon purpureus]|uniref:Adenylyl-sulfate kinase n=1 Tax=Ceratodon purpureus TaxID=3225 RepID=A0A8T0IIP5_CERPU|nr:hypothetical protein KC19_3G082500 [Ceratodon purpureus]